MVPGMKRTASAPAFSEEDPPMNDCAIEMNELLTYLERRADEDAARRLQSHVAECAKCQRDLAWLERILPLLPEAKRLREIETSPALAAAAARALPLFTERFPKPTRRSWIAR